MFSCLKTDKHRKGTVQYYSKVYCWLKTDIQAERRYNKVYSWLKTDIQAQRRYNKV